MDKFERLDEFLDRRDLASVWFLRPNSFAWLTGGSSVVDRSAPIGVAAIGYDGHTPTLLTNTIETDRIVAEEIPDLDIDSDQVVEFPWYDRSLVEAVTDYVDGPAAADVDVPSPEVEQIDPSSLCQPLTSRDVQRYRDVGRDTARAVETVCRELRPSDTEADVAAAVSVALATRNIEAPVILVGGSQRATSYRHYTPTDDELGTYALVSVTAQRRGLHASCTRTVAFEDAPSWLTDRHRAATRVDATALAATLACANDTASGDSENGRVIAEAESPDGVSEESGDESESPRARPNTAGTVFAAIQTAYEALGYKGEWRAHHQGGAAGFAGREWIATPGHAGRITAPMAYAWNPTVQGAKSEDTVLVTADGAEVLTTTGDWPTSTVSAIDREEPVALDPDFEIARHDVYHP